MRDIKFRAWDNNEEWMVDDMILSFDGEILTDDVQPHDTPYKEVELADEGRYELMQYTGMKDVKGVEIYEGDILQSEHYFKYKVVFEGDCWRCESLKNSRFKNRFIGRDLKVIGNIYENPELLED